MAEQRAHAESFIKSQMNVFSRSEYNIGCTRIIPHCIDTSDNAPYLSSFSITLCHSFHSMTSICSIMLQHDVTEPAVSPRCLNAVMVRKQDGSVWFCVDYRKVNELIKKDPLNHRFLHYLATIIVNTDNAEQ